MCIIVYKPLNAKMPDYTCLRNCFDNNEDGAGYMFADNGVVHIVKGLMTFNSFSASLTKTVKKYGKDKAYVMHFRWSTQAGIRKDCTHPFPLSKDMQKLRKLKTTCEIGIAHNGIISLTSSRQKSLTHNDTMEFITDYLSLIIKDGNYYKDADTLELIEKLTDSKFAILDGCGHCQLIGDNWIENNGVFYSNNGFKTYQYTFMNYGRLLNDDDGYMPYEMFFDYNSGLYDFAPETGCPADDDDYDFCCYCKNCDNCRGKSIELDGLETEPALKLSAKPRGVAYE